jgi:hypothetical protein
MNWEVSTGELPGLLLKEVFQNSKEKLRKIMKTVSELLFWQSTVKSESLEMIRQIC